MLKTLVAASIMAATVPAMAYEAGDIIVKAGVVSVMPKDNNADASAVVPDTDLDVQNDTQLGITAVYMVTPMFGVEVLAATPFEHEVEADGGALDGATIATTKHLPPTVSAQFYPLAGSSKLQPYVGLGVNHTFFFDEDDDAGIGTKGLKTSWGLSYSAGVDYLINDQWVVNAALWKMDIDTEIRGGAADGLEVEIDPLVVMVGAGMKF
ncbi:outer membrane protein OmpW [Bacterioplanes sanyensis]|uniref:Outer membrane protein OmpW n=2 Tax=Bacterioplanes sanyensis TaxID=1249553 RepID=A0A222FR07_9GAMM|nr:outer membrane protein OmpW [Bacterioplanes sanyensis]